ncbi:recombinase family protein [Chamaesiphon sp. VAR_69_metabat_338]|uniref:recombinase family protein n=1 Tax=Chamaesiphon sp. VAR_69_metabat_338 TaxID=2964704 RepID=UPI00286E11FD|nr:recombinase family protein [Chamaesiphon sp. VAR_69_metabat_338]
MQIVAYTYTDPIIEASALSEIWGWEIDRVYRDLRACHELDRLLQDSSDRRIDYLLVRRLDELGESVREVRQVLAKLQAAQIKLITTETEIEPQLNLLQLIDKIQSPLATPHR